jgi:glycosyltransferase involved in cell wall biosynthesis
MKILHYGLTDHLGGIETYLRKITLEMHAKEGLDFYFIIIGNKNPCFYEEFKELGCKFYFVTPRRENYLKNYFELKKIFKKEKFDVCHVHLNSLSYILPVKIASKYSGKVIIHSRNSNVKLGMLSRVLHNLNYFSIPNNAVLLAVSDLAGKWMFGNKKFKTVNNGIKIQKYKYNSKNRENLRLKLGIQDNIVLTNVGAFRYQKNHKFLLEVFKNLLEMNSSYKLLLVGNGVLLDSIKSQVEKLDIVKDVIFLGNRNDIADVLSASDAFIFPSFYEGFPNALLEAHVSNLPTFYSDSITNNIDYPKLSTRISLNKRAEEWARIIDSNLDLEHNRNCYTDNEELWKFSVENEINIIKKIYKGKLK